MKKRFKIFLCVTLLIVSLFLPKINSYASEDLYSNVHMGKYTFNYLFINNWENLESGQYRIYGNSNAFMSGGFYFDEIIFTRSATNSNIIYRDSYVGCEIAVADIILTGNEGLPGIHFIDKEYMYIQVVNGFNDIEQQEAFEVAYLSGIRTITHLVGVNTPNQSINGYYYFNFTNINSLIDSSIYGRFMFKGKPVNNIIIYDENEPRIRFYYDDGSKETFIVSDFAQNNYKLIITGNSYTTLSIYAFPYDFLIGEQPPIINNWDNFFVSLINVPLLYLQSLLNIEIFNVNIFYGIGSVVVILILCRLVKRLI